MASAVFFIHSERLESNEWVNSRRKTSSQAGSYAGSQPRELHGHGRVWASIRVHVHVTKVFTCVCVDAPTECQGNFEATHVQTPMK